MSYWNKQKEKKRNIEHAVNWIFIFATPFLQSDWEKYSMGELYEIAKTKKKKIIIIDAGKCFHPEVLRDSYFKIDPISPIEPDKYIILYTRKELAERLKEYSINGLFFPMFDDYYEVRNFYHLARKYDLSYGYVNNIVGDITVPKTVLKSNRIEQIINKIKNLRDISSIAYNRCLRHLFSFFSSKGKGMFFAVAGNNREVEILQNCNLIKDAKRIQAHTYDYEKYLRWKQNLGNEKHEEMTERPYMVFLDQYIPFHPDLAATGYQIDSNSYYYNVEKILDGLSEALNLEVIIAAHPKADYKNLPYFNRYKIFYNLTIPLIYFSDLVVGHFSSSLSFAVLERKRIVLIQDTSLKACPPYAKAISQYQTMLHCPMISEKSEVKNYFQIKADEKFYRKFIENTIGVVPDQQKNLWENIIEQILEG